MTEQLLHPTASMDPTSPHAAITRPASTSSKDEAANCHAFRPRPWCREVAAGDIVKGKDWTVSIANTWHASSPYLECLAYGSIPPGIALLYRRQRRGVRHCRRTGARLRRADPHVPLLHRHRAVGGIPKDVRQSYRRRPRRARGRRQTVVLTHKLEQIEQPGVRERMIREMSAIYDGDVIWGMAISWTCHSTA